MNTSSPPFRSSISTSWRSPPPRHFISTRRSESGGSIRLIVAGELDLAARHHFRSDLEGAQSDSDRVTLDLTALTFIDCPCLATLFVSARRARRGNAVLILLRPRGQVRRMLDLTGNPPGVTVLDHNDHPDRLAPIAA